MSSEDIKQLWREEDCFNLILFVHVCLHSNIAPQDMSEFDIEEPVKPVEFKTSHKAKKKNLKFDNSYPISMHEKEQPEHCQTSHSGS